jgi:hypothetical protein
MSHLHLVLTPRNRNSDAREKLTAAHRRLTELTQRPLVTDDHMAVEIAAIVADLIEVERYLQDPSMDWRRSHE